MRRLDDRTGLLSRSGRTCPCRRGGIDGENGSCFAGACSHTSPDPCRDSDLVPDSGRGHRSCNWMRVMQVGRGRRTGREAFDYRRVENPRSESDSVPSHASNRNSLGPSPFPCRRRVAWNHGASCFVARCCFAWKPSRGPESKVYFFVCLDGQHCFVQCAAVKLPSNLQRHSR